MAIKDYAAAAGVIEAERLTVLNEQRYTDLERWLLLIPATVLVRHPLLLLSQAWIDWFRFADARGRARVDAAQQLLQHSPDLLSPEMLPIVQAEIDALLARFSKTLSPEERLALTRCAWNQIQAIMDRVPANALYFLANSFHTLGEGQAGLDLIAAALDSPLDWTPGARSLLLFKRGLIHQMSGRLAGADIAFRQALQLARECNLLYLVSVTNYFLGMIADPRNDLASAEQHFLAVLRIPLDLNYYHVVPILYHLIGIYADQGRVEFIDPWLEKLRTYGRVATIPFLLDGVTTLDARQAFVRGDLARALRWAQVVEHATYSGTNNGPILQSEILLAVGSPTSLQKADQVLQKLHSRCRSQYDLHGLISVLVLQALTWEKMGKRAEALAALDEAVSLAVPHGHIRTFLEQGAPMVQLLRAMRDARLYAPWVDLLIREFPQEAPPSDPFARHDLRDNNLVESLSERETAVLSLLAQSYTNQEIARQLIISVNTVRNHTVNIYGKLGVGDRRQAVAKAQALGLLSRV